MGEEWRSIDGYQGFYEISDQGRVRRCAGSFQTPADRVLTPWPKGPLGHLAIGLTIHGVRRVFSVHRLVLATFVGPCPDGMEVRHLDGNSQNNHLANLAYGTPSENAFDMLRHGTHFNGSKTHCKWGHEFTPENTRPNTYGKGRRCVACNRASRARSRARRKAA